MSGDVAAGLADARDDLVGNPALEGFGLGLAAAQDERVQAGLVDNCSHLGAASLAGMTVS